MDLRFLAWFLAELVDALKRMDLSSQAAQHVVEQVDAGGQTSRYDGQRYLTRRQSNLVPRPNTPIIVMDKRHALGDTKRHRQFLEPQQGGFSILLLPFAAAAPPDITSWYGVSAPDGTTLFAGENVPRSSLTLAIDGWFRLFGEPHFGVFYPAYNGIRPIMSSDAIATMIDTHPRRVGPNWFFPYASLYPHATLGFEVPAFIPSTLTGPPYWCLSDAFVGGVHTWAPDAEIKPVPHNYPMVLQTAALAGGHYVLPKAQGREVLPEEHGGTLTPQSWPLALTRGPVFDEWEMVDELLDWDVQRYADTQTVEGQAPMWRYHFEAIQEFDGLSFDVTHLHIDLTPTWHMDADYNHVVRVTNDLGTGSPPAGWPYADGRDPTPRGIVNMNYFDEGVINPVSVFKTVTASCGPTVMKGLINQSFTYDIATGVLTLTTRFGLVAYAETAFAVHDYRSDPDPPFLYQRNDTPLWEGVGFTLGGKLDAITSEPAYVGPEQTRYDPSDPRMTGMSLQRGSLRVLYFEDDLTSDQIAMWWSQSIFVMRARDKYDFPSSAAAVPLGIEHDFTDTGFAQVILTWTLPEPPAVPTVGRFDYDDFGPTPITGIGLRMSHQESFDDFATGATERIIGRIMTLVEPEELRAYIPPINPAPHTFGIDATSVNLHYDGDAYASYAAMVGTLAETAYGDLLLPYSGGAATFCGLAIDATGPYWADAITSPTGSIIGILIRSNLSMAVSVDGVPAWEGDLIDLLAEGDLTGATPVQTLRHLLPGWPFITTDVELNGLTPKRLVFRARTLDDQRAPGDAPIVVSHWQALNDVP